MAATSANVNLGGTVASTLAIVSVPTAAATNLLGLGAGAVEVIVKVSDLAITTNNSTGYTLTATSTGLLTKGAVGPDIVFTMTTVLDGVAAPLTGVAVASPYVFDSTAAGAVPLDLYIAYTPAAVQDPGDYAGSIALIVTDSP